MTTLNVETYAIYKFWIMAKTKKNNFNTANITKFITKDMLNRTLYKTENYFTTHRIKEE